MKRRGFSATVALAALAPVLLLSLTNCKGCKNDDDDKPAPVTSAAPVPTPTPVTTATVMPEEDAGAPGDAGVDAGKPKGPAGPGGGSGTLAACCAALQQNANNAPLDQKAYYMAAAQYC